MTGLREKNLSPLGIKDVHEIYNEVSKEYIMSLMSSNCTTLCIKV